ncbi:hypothetical protein EDB84DRAFT_892478 [Lactarius hengduanensis]|nr:hypothetical protein EDB84DRAFT_892478 [Lactarius hengduanensis]
MHRANCSAYPSPSLNHDRLPDHSLDISPAVLPSSIARQPRLPYTRPSLSTRPRLSRSRPRRSSLHQSRPQTSPPSQASRWRSFQNPLANSATCTCRLILQILCANYKRRNSTRSEGFCYERAAVDAHGLLATSLAAEPTPTSDSGAFATTTNSAPATATDPDDLQDASLDLDLDLDISMDLGDGPVPAGEDESADTHAVVVGDAPTHSPPPLLRIAGTHNHPDGPTLGFVIPEHDDVDHSLGASVDVDRALTSPSQGLSFDLTSSNRGGEGSIDWCSGNVLVVQGAGTDAGAGEYAGNGTIDACVLGGGGNLSPGKLGDDPSSPVRKFGGVQHPRATDEDDEEEDGMGTLFENTSDDDFVPPSELGKGKGRAVASSSRLRALLLPLVQGCGGRAGARSLQTKLRTGTMTAAMTKAPLTMVHARTQYPVFTKCPSQKTQPSIVVIWRAPVGG